MVSVTPIKKTNDALMYAITGSAPFLGTVARSHMQKT